MAALQRQLNAETNLCTQLSICGTDRHVSGAAGTASLRLGVHKSTTDAKVTQLDATALIHQNVGRLHVCYTHTSATSVLYVCANDNQ